MIKTFGNDFESWKTDPESEQSKYYAQYVCEYTFVNVYEIECGTLNDGFSLFTQTFNNNNTKFSLVKHRVNLLTGF